jgi:hypothetical protein
MAALEAATQPATVSERKTLLRPQTRARWVAGSSPAMVNWGLNIKQQPYHSKARRNDVFLASQGGGARAMRKTILLALLLAGVPCAASADDGAASLATGSIAFTKVAPVRMKSEDLYISPQKVRVRFEFENDTDRDFETVVAFPLPDVDVGEHWTGELGPISNDPVNFVGFSARVDGKPVALQSEQRAVVEKTKRDVTALVKAAKLPLNTLMRGEEFEKREGSLPPAEVKQLEAAGVLDEGIPNWILKTKFYWTQRFPAHQTVVIEHDYQPVSGSYNSAIYFADHDQGDAYCVDPRTSAAIKGLQAWHDKKGDSSFALYTDYILKTAKTWNGPIGRFHMTLDKLKPEHLLAVCWIGELKKTTPTTFEFTAEQFTPDRDVHMVVLE